MNASPPELLALLAECRCRPADDLPRLVLADWLDENGQPERAEFVRVQVEVAHPTADVDRIRRLKKREAELLAEHEDEWTGGYQSAAAFMTPMNRRREDGGFAPIPPGHRFVRGLMRISNAAEFIDRTEMREWLRSQELPWVEQIDFTFSTIEWFVKADLPDELHGRIGLNVGYSGPGPDSHRAQLRLLAVSSNFTAVRALTARRSSVPAAEVVNELARADLTSLVALTLPTDIPGGAAEAVASAPFTSLSALDIGPIPEAGLRALTSSPHLGNLTHLNLVRSPIGDSGMVALCRSRLAHTLRRVEFPNTDIGDAGVKALAASPLLAHMHGPRLNLMMNRIGDDGLTALAESEHLLRFRELVLRENVVGDAGVEALAASPFAANLQFLDFWRNRITDRGARALAASPHLNKVVDLSVKENAVTSSGAAALHARFGERAKV